MQITVNETGAKTLNDSRPMQIAGQFVYVTMGAGTASLIVGGRIVAERSADDMSTTEAQTWAADYRDSMNEVSEVVKVIRQRGAELNVKADEVEATPLTVKQARRIDESDPRHPVNAAAYFRRQAAVLAAWTDADEAAYQRHLDDGISGTDGYFAPEPRQTWKLALNA
jgi:hypothetical protein